MKLGLRQNLTKMIDSLAQMSTGLLVACRDAHFHRLGVETLMIRPTIWITGARRGRQWGEVCRLLDHSDRDTFKTCGDRWPSNENVHEDPNNVDAPFYTDSYSTNPW